MAYRVPRAGVIDRVWLAAEDGRWHSRRGLVQRTGFEGEEVTAALRFLVKYGFAESSFAGEQRFRMVIDGPSPMEAANLLWDIGREADLLVSHGGAQSESLCARMLMEAMDFSSRKGFHNHLLIANLPLRQGGLLFGESTW